MKKFRSLILIALLPLVLVVVGCNSDDESDSMPEVVSVSPESDAVDVSINATISVTFNKEMNPDTFNDFTFTLYRDTLRRGGAITFDGNTVTFTPTIPLRSFTVFEVTVANDVKDMDGNSLAADYVFTFTTGKVPEVVDTTAPTVLSTLPSNSATGVVRNRVISIQFSEDMQESSFNSSTVVVTQGTTPVAGSIEYTNQFLKFIPTGLLAATVNYTVKITTGVKDLAGNGLASDLTLNFTTGATGGRRVVSLRTAARYTVFAKTSVSNTPISSVIGNVAVSPGTSANITGFDLVNAGTFARSTQVSRSIFASDMDAPTNTNLEKAVADMDTAYAKAVARIDPQFRELGDGNIGGETLAPGLYRWTTGVSIPSSITLSGNATDVWIFQVAGGLDVAANVNMTFSGDVKAANIFWQVAEDVVVGASAHLEGTILCKEDITMGAGASITGRLMSQGSITLNANTITRPVQ